MVSSTDTKIIIRKIEPKLIYARFDTVIGVKGLTVGRNLNSTVSVCHKGLAVLCCHE